MNRPQKIKQIYRELQMMLGDEFPAHELLESAALLIAIVEDDNPSPVSRPKDPWVPFDEWAVDKVFAEGGWLLLSLEDWWRQRLGEDDVMSLQAKMQLKDYLVGGMAA